MENKRWQLLSNQFRTSDTKESYSRFRLERVPNDVDEKYLEMEKILNSRKINNKFQYLVKWKNISEKETTWEFEEKFDSP